MILPYKFQPNVIATEILAPSWYERVRAKSKTRPTILALQIPEGVEERLSISKYEVDVLLVEGSLTKAWCRYSKKDGVVFNTLQEMYTRMREDGRDTVKVMVWGRGTFTEWVKTLPAGRWLLIPDDLDFVARLERSSIPFFLPIQIGGESQPVEESPKRPTRKQTKKHTTRKRQ